MVILDGKASVKNTRH